MASGALFLRLIAWSQVQEGGNRCASSLNTEAYFLYTSRSSTCVGSDLACMVRSVEMPWLVHSSSNWVTIACCSSWWSGPFVRQMLWHMMGRYCGSRAPSFHLKQGLKVASHRYPSMRLSLPKSETRNLICRSFWLVVTQRSTYRVTFPALFCVSSTLKSFFGLFSKDVPKRSCCTVWGWMKLSVAPLHWMENYLLPVTIFKYTQ